MINDTFSTRNVEFYGIMIYRLFATINFTVITRGPGFKILLNDIFNLELSYTMSNLYLHYMSMDLRVERFDVYFYCPSRVRVLMRPTISQARS